MPGSTGGSWKRSDWSGSLKWDNPTGNRGHQGFWTYRQNHATAPVPDPTHARFSEPDDLDRALFPRVHATGAVGATAMTGHAVNEMIHRRAAATGFTPAQVTQLGGHSLRAGFVTEAFRAGADAHAIMRQTGHRSPVMLEVYAREHAPLVGNAVTRLGL